MSTSRLGKLLFVYFFALLLPLTLFPTKTVFEAVWQFEGNRRVSGLFKVSNVRSFLSLCSSFPQTLKAQPYRGIGAKEEGSGTHSSAKVEFQPSSVRAKGLCARKNKHASVRERMPRNMPLPFLPSSCEATQSSANNVGTYQERRHRYRWSEKAGTVVFVAYQGTIRYGPSKL